jgi:hypothetical protein
MTGCRILTVQDKNGATPGQERWLLVHYFNWFKTPEGRGGWHNWEWSGNGPDHNPEEILPDGRRDIASVYYPLIGPYDSADPLVIQYHMLSARAAHIDGFFIDWYGLHSDEDRHFPALLEQAAELDFSMCICFEDKAMFGYTYQAATRAEAVSNAVENLCYILEKYGRHPAYFRIDGKPVIINFSWSEPDHTVQAQGFSAREYADILSRVRAQYDFWFVHDYHTHLQETYWDIADSMYPWLDVNGPALEAFHERLRRGFENGRYPFMSTLIYPGFDNTGVWGWGEGPFVTPREEGEFYRRSWRRALDLGAQFLQVATWNDFGEGATIEPARDYGFQYLEMTEKFAAAWKHLPSDPGQTRWPYLWYRAMRAVQAEPEAQIRVQLEQDLFRERNDFLARLPVRP